MLFILASVGLLILVVACINYLNLTSAQALTQTKALAVRKVCGAPRFDLIRQMVQESVLVSLVALPFALLAGHFALPYISQLLGNHTHSPLPTNSGQFAHPDPDYCGNRSFIGFYVAVKITSFRVGRNT